MLDGLWTAEFGSSTGEFGGGVIILQNGKILGGDAGYFYIGEYTLTAGIAFRASVKVSPFIVDYQSVFKTSNQEFTLDLTGVYQGTNQMTAQGHLKGMPHLTLGVKLTKRT